MGRKELFEELIKHTTASRRDIMEEPEKTREQLISKVGEYLGMPEEEMYKLVLFSMEEVVTNPKLFPRALNLLIMLDPDVEMALGSLFTLGYLLALKERDQYLNFVTGEEYRG